MGDHDRKRGPETYSDGSPRKEMRSGTIIKMLCPFYSAGAIIGDGGKEIKSIKENTGVSIQVSKKDVRFPGTDERIVTLQGECEVLKKVVKLIQDLIRNDKPPPSAKNVDIDSNEKRKRALKLVVADTSAGRIIGKGGETIKALKDKYAVVVNTSKKHETPAYLDERIVSVEGDTEEVDNCVEEMIDTVCSDKQARMSWWVDYNNLGSGYDDGYGRAPQRGGYGGHGGEMMRGGYDRGYGGGHGGGYGGGHGGGHGGGKQGGYGGGYDSHGYGGHGGGYGGGHGGGYDRPAPGGYAGGYDDGYGHGGGYGGGRSYGGGGYGRR